MTSLNLGNHKYKRNGKEQNSPIKHVSSSHLKPFPRAKSVCLVTSHEKGLERNHGGNRKKRD